MITRHHIMHERQEWSLRPEARSLRGTYSLHHAVVVHNFPTVKSYAKKYPAIKTMMGEMM